MTDTLVLAIALLVVSGLIEPADSNPASVSWAQGFLHGLRVAGLLALGLAGVQFVIGGTVS